MPGRKRHSWMLNLILDTSASMSDDIPGVLGAIADFCDAAGVDEIRVVPVEGERPPSINGAAVAAEGQALASGDVLEIAGIRLELVIPGAAGA